MSLRKDFLRELRQLRATSTAGLYEREDGTVGVHGPYDLKVALDCLRLEAAVLGLIGPGASAEEEQEQPVETATTVKAAVQSAMKSKRVRELVREEFERHGEKVPGPLALVARVRVDGEEKA
jgi:hypothetical protein